MATIDSIRIKVEKLLRMAADREGTPEGDVFRDKAFELMAQYGVEAAQLRSDNPNDVVKREVEFAGTYTDMQFTLLNQLGTILHCQVIMFKIPRSSRVQTGVLFGCQHHVDRVLMLHGLLSNHMIAGAVTFADAYPDPYVSVQTQKRSWMTGFISEVSARLREVEAQHTDDYARVNDDGEHTSGALVLREDRTKAEDLAAEHFPNLVRNRSGRRTLDPDSYHHGASEGSTMDLGQTRMSGGRKSLPSGALF